MRTIRKPDAKIIKFIEEIYGVIFKNVMHTKTYKSIMHMVFGIINSPKLYCASLGDTLAQRFGLSAKHTTKQVSRLFGNERINVWELLPCLARRILTLRKEVVVALDWTEFDSDDHSTLMLSIVTKHGRAAVVAYRVEI